jgi:hypothetical protein
MPDGKECQDCNVEMELVENCCDAGICDLRKSVHHYTIDPYYRCPKCGRQEPL